MKPVVKGARKGLPTTGTHSLSMTWRGAHHESLVSIAHKPVLVVSKRETEMETLSRSSANAVASVSATVSETRHTV